jgi:hypothetical protein
VGKLVLKNFICCLEPPYLKHGVIFLEVARVCMFKKVYGLCFVCLWPMFSPNKRDTIHDVCIAKYGM